MKPIVKLGYIAAACALLVATFSIIGPRAVQAVVATLVQVANTKTAPVPNVDVNAPGEEVFQTQLCAASGPGYVCSPSPSTFTVPTSTLDGSTVVRLVLTTVTGYCEQNGTNVVLGRIGLSAGGTSVQYISPLQSNPTEPPFLSIMGPAPLYADPGTTITDSVVVSAASAACIYDLAGYYVTH